jgi:hypothetical protein
LALFLLIYIQTFGQPAVRHKNFLFESGVKSHQRAEARTDRAALDLNPANAIDENL